MTSAYVFRDSDNGVVKRTARSLGFELTNDGFSSNDDHAVRANEISEMRRAGIVIAYMGPATEITGIGILQSAFAEHKKIIGIRPFKDKERSLPPSVLGLIGEVVYYKSNQGLRKILKSVLCEVESGKEGNSPLGGKERV